MARSQTLDISPGPYTVDADFFFVSILDANGKRIMRTGGRDRWQARANASLFAKAWDMQALIGPTLNLIDLCLVMAEEVACDRRLGADLIRARDAWERVQREADIPIFVPDDDSHERARQATTPALAAAEAAPDPWAWRRALALEARADVKAKAARREEGVSIRA